MKILVTGACGFIGFHVAKKLCESYEVVGIDHPKYCSANELWNKRREKLLRIPSFHYLEMDLANPDDMWMLAKYQFDAIIHLAAVPGVARSIYNPLSYLPNISGFLNLLEWYKHDGIPIYYASSSSITGDHDDASRNYPLSFYATTKKTNELTAHNYHHLYGMNTVGMRFFTVYGPYGRPDMAVWKFSDAIINNMPIHLYNNGELFRSFTYIEDVVKSIELLLCKKPKGYHIVDIGCNQSFSVPYLIEKLEALLGQSANVVKHEGIRGESKVTQANPMTLLNLIGYSPSTELGEGLKEWVKWYKEECCEA